MIDNVLAAEQRSGATVTLRNVLTELVQDISEVARTIGTTLHPVPSRRS